MKLLGDFDGSSAFELLNMLKKKSNGAGKIFVHTSGLKEIHPSGSEVFRSHSDILKGPSHRLIFTGENGSRIAPKGSIVIWKEHKLNQLKGVLMQRLEKKGVELKLIPGLIKTIAGFIPCISHTNLEEMNRRLHLLGWDGFELDDHTLQLVIASLENDGSIDSERNKSNQVDK